MSSYYSVICLSHDPCIVDDASFSDLDKAVARAESAHPNCDILIGVWSGGLVSLICPANHQKHTPLHALHSLLKRIDSEWIQVLIALHNHCPTDIPHSLRYGCWNSERIKKIMPLLT